MADITERGDLAWMAWEIRSCAEKGHAYIEVKTQSDGRRASLLVLSAAELEAFIAGATKALRSIAPEA